MERYKWKVKVLYKIIVFFRNNIGFIDVFISFKKVVEK